jgi:uncharacterized protein involved in exopolysaccharide biosynthesis
MIEERINIFNTLFRNRVTISIITFCAIIVSIVLALILPKQYTSITVILPSGTVPGVFGLIGSFSSGGFMESGSSDEISSFLFPELLSSFSLYSLVCNTPVNSAIKRIKPESETIKDLEGWSVDSRGHKIFIARSKIKYSIEKGILVISYTTKKELIEQLDESEDSLEKFISSHRNFARDPILKIKYNRYNSSVQIKHELLIYVQKQLEIAVLDSKGSAPVVKILDPPNLPTKKSGPKRSLILIFGTLIGFIISLIVVAFRENKDKLFARLKP